MMKKYDVIIFDLDGTLSNSGEGITKSVQYALKRFGIIEENLDNLKHFVGPPMKEEMMLNLISDYLSAGQVDNAQHLYDNMLEYAEQEYGKVSQMTAMTYFEKAHLYERVGDLDLSLIHI